MAKSFSLSADLGVAMGEDQGTRSSRNAFANFISPQLGHVSKSEDKVSAISTVRYIQASFDVVFTQGRVLPLES